MLNNDILRRLRFTFNYTNAKMVKIFALVDLKVEESQIVSWLQKEGASGFVECNDNQLAHFLDGLIIEKRGKKKDGKPHVPEKRLNNNVILTKLKIALSLRAEDIVEMMKSTNLTVSKTELSAFFRHYSQQNYRMCHDQFIRNFLYAIDNKFQVQRPAKYLSEKSSEETASNNSPQDSAADKQKYTDKKKPAESPYKQTRTASVEPEEKKKVFVNPNAEIWGKARKPKSADDSDKKTLSLKKSTD